MKKIYFYHLVKDRYGTVCSDWFRKFRCNCCARTHSTKMMMSSVLIPIKRNVENISDQITHAVIADATDEHVLDELNIPKLRCRGGRNW